jgi:FkbM family methyltransferase
MRARSISGKLTQLSHLPLRLWGKFIQAWVQRGRTGHVPCVLPGAHNFIQVPLHEFYETYWFFSESRQGIRELKFFVDRLRPSDVVYDIGAFRGAYGAAAKAALGDAVMVHLFEPVPKNLEGICTVARLNQFNGFKVVGKAVGAGTTIKGMLNTEDAMLRQGDLSDALVSVEFPSTSVDAYIAETGAVPTVMKVDVEGFELEVMEGARKCLAAHRPRLWLELHPSYLEAQGKRWEEVIDTLKSLGYRTPTLFEDYDLPTRKIAFHVWCEA